MVFLPIRSRMQSVIALADARTESLTGNAVLANKVLVTQYVENRVLFLVGPSAKPYPSLENDKDCIRLVALGKDGLAIAKEHHPASRTAGRKKGLRVERTV